METTRLKCKCGSPLPEDASSFELCKRCQSWALSKYRDLIKKFYNDNSRRIREQENIIGKKPS